MLPASYVRHESPLETDTAAEAAAFMQHATRASESHEILVIPSWGRAQWSALFSCTQPIELDAGDVLIQPRHVDRALFFVASGRLEVPTTSEADSSVGARALCAAGRGGPLFHPAHGI